MIADMHTHILPRVDDGSPNLETSVRMLDAMYVQGIRRVAATPHFYANHDSPKRFLARRAAAEEALRQAWKWEDLELRVGAEVHYFDGISDCDDLEAMAIAGTDLVLVEMQSAPWSDRCYEELLGIRQKRGLTPVIAHLDRYITPFHRHGIPERLAQLPVLVQLNAESLLQFNGRGMLLRMLREGKVHLLGSDCHSMGSRKPNLADAWKLLERKLDSSVLENLANLEESLWTKS